VVQWEFPIHRLSKLATIFSAFCAVPIAVAALIVAVKQLKDVKRQIAQSRDHILTELSNQHNWRLYELRRDLPPFVPSWSRLSQGEKAWAWRTLFLNHLNLLFLAYQERAYGKRQREELEQWKRRARYWFSGLFTTGRKTKDMKVGLQVLDQLLHGGEAAYPDEFVKWLEDEQITPKKGNGSQGAN
jgi:hypothetical protein